MTVNWEIILLAVIAAVPPTVVAAAAVIQARKTHEAVNSRMTELLEISRKQAADSATLAEKKAESARQGDAAVAAANAEGKP